MFSKKAISNTGKLIYYNNAEIAWKLCGKFNSKETPFQTVESTFKKGYRKKL